MVRSAASFFAIATLLAAACGDPQASNDETGAEPAGGRTPGAPAASADGTAPAAVARKPPADIVSVLQQASERGFTGTVAFDRPGITKMVYFRQGQLIFATSTMGQDRLVSILLRHGKLTDDQLRQAKAKATDKVPVAKAIIDLGFLSKEQMLEAVRLQFSDIVLSLRDWPGTMRFRPGEVPEAIAKSAVPVPVPDLLTKLRAPPPAPTPSL